MDVETEIFLEKKNPKEEKAGEKENVQKLTNVQSQFNERFRKFVARVVLAYFDKICFGCPCQAFE